MNKLMRSAATVGVASVVAVLASATAALAEHEHLVKITNPHTGEVTCQYVARGATPTNDNFHDRAHTGPGKAHRSDRAYIEKEGSVQGDTCDEVRGRQSEEVEGHTPHHAH